MTMIAGKLQRVRGNKLIRELVATGLDTGDFVVFGSAPLLAHGLRVKVRDLDVVARGEALRWAQETGTPGIGTCSGDPVWQLSAGRIQISAGWINSAWDTDELIDNAEVIDGIRFARIRDVLRYKRELRRPKDLVDIRAIRKYLAIATSSSAARHDLTTQPTETLGDPPGLRDSARLSPQTPLDSAHWAASAGAEPLSATVPGFVASEPSPCGLA